LKKIAIIFGGVSYEHEISIVSAITINNKLNTETILIFLDKNRDFYEIPSQKMNSKLFSSHEYIKMKKLNIKSGGFYYKTIFNEVEVKFDVALNLIHGGDGEDGKLASLFSFYNIPFIGPRVEASVLSSNKALTKAYAKELGVDVLEYKSLNINQARDIEIEYPVIIKPVHLGSSIGLSVVKNEDELDYALDIAFEYDSDIIIEPFIKGIKEYNLAGCMVDNNFIFSIIEEPQKGDLLDFDTKYLDFSRSSAVLQADIDKSLINKIKDNFKIIYSSYFEGALIRCDFFILNNRVYLNEINPIPGSMANYLFDDFETILLSLSNSLPTLHQVDVNYRYINTIQSAKGKL